jgi:hypothetical protein
MEEAQLLPGQWRDNCPDVFDTVEDAEELMRMVAVEEGKLLEAATLRASKN